jgi:hypothetical protein
LSQLFVNLSRLTDVLETYSKVIKQQRKVVNLRNRKKKGIRDLKREPLLDGSVFCDPSFIKKSLLGSEWNQSPCTHKQMAAKKTMNQSFDGTEFVGKRKDITTLEDLHDNLSFGDNPREDYCHKLAGFPTRPIKKPKVSIRSFISSTKAQLRRDGPKGNPGANGRRPCESVGPKTKPSLMNISVVGTSKDLFGVNLNRDDKGFEKSEMLDIKADTSRAKDRHGRKSSVNK